MSNEIAPQSENAICESCAKRGDLWVLSAPSGAGKTTLIRTLLETFPTVAEGMTFSVSHTTRAPRQGETDGHDYHFVDRATFERMVAEGRFLEWAEVHGRFYGTSCAEVDRHLDRGFDVLLDIDVQGADQVRQRCPEVRTIFILPPNFAALEERLRRRGKDAQEQIARRLVTARSEVLCSEKYDYVILNAEIRSAVEALAAVILARRHRRERMGERIKDVLLSFRDQTADRPTQKTQALPAQHRQDAS